jgi:hypothetical protein
MSNVTDATHQILVRIQEDMASFRREVSHRFDVIEQRMTGIEDLSRKQRRDTAGLLVMAKAVTGDFAEQVAAIEERVAVLEARGR